MLEGSKRISDFIDVEQLQAIQDNCSKAMGLAFVTVDYRGRPITKYSGFTPHCKLGREIQGFSEMCEQCDAHGGLHSAITGQPYIYRCHADLVDFAVPLIFNGSYMGAVMGGQVRLQDEEERELERILPQQTNWRKNQALDEAYRQAETITYEKLESAVKVLRDMILYTIQDHYNRTMVRELEGKDKELAEARAVRSDLEFAIQKQELNSFQQQESSRYFFFVMNVITRLAFQEKAVQTEAVAYDFADIMRYTTDPDHKISTLGEELSYIGALLRIQKAWIGEGLEYSISVPERYWGASCPFMTFQPVVELLLQGCEAESRRIDVFAEEDGEDLLLQILSNNEAVTMEELEAQTSGPFEKEHFSLRDTDRNLKRTFGKRYGLWAEPRKDGRPGCAVRFKLPLKREK
ncbi:MAG: histidine kinase [Flavonifractor sp.]|nr:histidine kinase [Flavonifractor sp.]